MKYLGLVEKFHRLLLPICEPPRKGRSGGLIRGAQAPCEAPEAASRNPGLPPSSLHSAACGRSFSVPARRRQAPKQCLRRAQRLFPRVLPDASARDPQASAPRPLAQYPPPPSSGEGRKPAFLQNTPAEAGFVARRPWRSASHESLAERQRQRNGLDGFGHEPLPPIKDARSRRRVRPRQDRAQRTTPIMPMGMVGRALGKAMASVSPVPPPYWYGASRG